VRYLDCCMDDSSGGSFFDWPNNQSREIRRE
jgi:hypothetical protein